MSERGILVILSGPSGAGKGTVLREAFEKNKNLRLSVSVTTRAPRAGEVEGEHYFFKTQEEFAAMLASGEFLEHEDVFGNSYGTPKAEVEKKLAAGYDVILEIDVKGALNVKKLVPDAVMIFLTPSKVSEIERRLRGRMTETPEAIEKRIKTAFLELSAAGNYEYIAINDDAKKCSDDILDIIRAEKHKTERNTEFIEKIRAYPKREE